jgi:hypothetical protein
MTQQLTKEHFTNNKSINVILELKDNTGKWIGPIFSNLKWLEPCNLRGENGIGTDNLNFTYAGYNNGIYYQYKNLDDLHCIRILRINTKLT